MEDALVHVYLAAHYTQELEVLILVLMEDALVRVTILKNIATKVVLILVLMEDALVQKP